MSTILIDLDHTLFNNTAFKAALAQSLSLNQAEWNQAYEKFVNTNETFEPKAFLLGTPSKEKKAFQQVVKTAQRFLYPDSLTFMQSAHNKKYKIVLVTFGDIVWQKQKLAALKLPNYIKVLPTNTTKIAVLADYIEPATLLIDDNAYEINALVKQWPHLKAYWITRPEGKYKHTEPIVPFTAINSLNDINL